MFTYLFSTGLKCTYRNAINPTYLLNLKQLKGYSNRTATNVNSLLRDSLQFKSFTKTNYSTQTVCIFYKYYSDSYCNIRNPTSKRKGIGEKEVKVMYYLNFSLAKVIY